VPDCFLTAFSVATVMGLRADRGVDVKEREIWPDELESFEQCFLTGTAPRSRRWLIGRGISRSATYSPARQGL
jgi:hypothetical protein